MTTTPCEHCGSLNNWHAPHCPSRKADPREVLVAVRDIDAALDRIGQQLDEWTDLARLETR